MGIEESTARFFQMSDAVWERHTNPWSVWIGSMNMIPVVLICLWIWFNPRVFKKPSSTDHWASRAVLGERVLLKHPKSGIPAHHRRAIRTINVITFAGFITAIYGLFALNGEYSSWLY